jgi:hypothetical protein
VSRDRHGRASRASRTPLQAQRAPGGKKLRKVERVWPPGVRQELPRRTCWFTMNWSLFYDRTFLRKEVFGLLRIVKSLFIQLDDVKIQW